MRPYFNCHTHTMYSNLRLVDSINKPEDLINKAIELGLSGIAITDHECLSAHIEVEKHMKDVKKEHPDFKIAYGNEIYLIDERKPGQKYYHFILIAKDAIGHRALRELSSKAWMNSYVDRRMERVPTTKAELKEVVEKFKGHLIATTACIGGELPSLAIIYSKARIVNDNANAMLYYKQINDFLNFCIDLFGEDFYIECAPGTDNDQVTANIILRKIADYYGIKMVVGTDAHYLTKNERSVHKAYLNSKEGDREVDSFYEFTYLMDSDEVTDLLSKSFTGEKSVANEILDNTLEIQEKIQEYSLFHKQDIPSVVVKDYPQYLDMKKYNFSEELSNVFDTKYPHLMDLFCSDDIQNRYWVNQCFEALIDKGIGMNETYITELEEEARVKSVISEKLETNMFRYPNTLQHYIDLIWNCGSMVGAGRGSSCAALNHYLMGITQLDPIEWELPFFRYLNDERVELGDIDIDICPSKCGLVLQKIAAERSQMFKDDVPEWAKKSFGCTRISTFGTEGTKSAVLTACRGYRSEDYPEGIDVDQAQYMASLIPQERGFLWPIKDVLEGNEEKNRKPVSTFIREVNNYPGLLDIIKGIEGLVNKRSSHASGIVLFDGDPFEHSAFMKTPKGEIITQYNLHDAEYMGLTKYDFLVTEVQDKIVQTIQFLQEDGEIEKDLNLREIYNKYLHPSVLPIKTDTKMWDALGDVSVINTFQFDSAEGSKAAKQLKPRTILEMADANGLIRLMGEEGQERPIDKYYRYKNDISLWYEEMDTFGLTKAEQKTLEPYFKQSYGVPPSQEQLMKMLMDKDICGFTLGEANNARKIVGKKQMSKIPALRQQVLDSATSPRLGQYVWRFGAGPQMGYSFSVIHALAYSFVGAQTLYLGTHWNPIYWDTACLVVNSGSLEDAVDEDGEALYDEEETEDTTKKKATSTDYGKVAKALNDIIDAGINVSLVNINGSDFGFKPDVKNNRILFGMKALLNVNDDLVNKIIENRPYRGIKDFYNRVKPTKQAMVSLIKAGAFDDMMERKLAMAWYIWETCDKKSRLTLQNFPTLVKQDMVPKDTSERQLAYRVYEFNRYLKAMCKDSKYTLDYVLNARAIEFLYELGFENMIEENELLNMKKWDKKYQVFMDTFRDWLKEDGENILTELNTRIFKADWDKYAGDANYSAWEMEVLCFYKHEHELAKVDMNKYGLSNFNDLPEEPEVERTFYKNNKAIHLFKLSRIAGTCIAKNKVKGVVTILTTDGVVNVKFRKEYFALFDKRISERGEDGVKHVVEKSWFDRGSMIMVQGVRSGDAFITKKYASSVGHQLYHILKVDENGDLVLQNERYKGEGGE